MAQPRTGTSVSKEELNPQVHIVFLGHHGRDTKAERKSCAKLDACLTATDAWIAQAKSAFDKIPKVNIRISTKSVDVFYQRLLQSPMCEGVQFLKRFKKEDPFQVLDGCSAVESDSDILIPSNPHRTKNYR